VLQLQLILHLGISVDTSLEPQCSLGAATLRAPEVRCPKRTGWFEFSCRPKCTEDSLSKLQDALWKAHKSAQLIPQVRWRTQRKVAATVCTSNCVRPHFAFATGSVKQRAHAAQQAPLARPQIRWARAHKNALNNSKHCLLSSAHQAVHSHSAAKHQLTRFPPPLLSPPGRHSWPSFSALRLSSRHSAHD